jgi:hypothetical protein
MWHGISLQDMSPYKYNYAWLTLSYKNAFTDLPLIHPTVIINNDRVEDCQSQLKMFIIYTQLGYMFPLE